MSYDLVSDIAGSTRPVIDDELLAEVIGKFLGDDAPDRIGCTAGRLRDQQANGPSGIYSLRCLRGHVLYHGTILYDAAHPESSSVTAISQLREACREAVSGARSARMSPLRLSSIGSGDTSARYATSVSPE